MGVLNQQTSPGGPPQSLRNHRKIARDDDLFLPRGTLQGVDRRASGGSRRFASAGGVAAVFAAVRFCYGKK